MSLELATLPPPDVLEPLDFETAYRESLLNFRSAMGLNWSADLESEPVVKVIEEAAYQKVLARARINDAGKSLLLAYAQRGDLDQLGANVNLERLVLQPGDSHAVPPVPEVKESDDAFKERIQLAFEGLTTAGPRSSYILHARSASAAVGDAWVESPKPAEVVITVLGLEGEGEASAELLGIVAAAVTGEDVRPLGDRVTVQSAEVLRYQIHAVLHMLGAGPENEAILAAARNNLKRWVTRADGWA